MRRLTILKLTLGIGAVLLLPGYVSAGTLAPPSAPSSSSSQMSTLQQICDRISSGTAATTMTTFTEPTAAPGTTMCTLATLMGLTPAGIDNTNGATTGDVFIGKTFWGLRSGGGWGPLTGTLPLAARLPKTGQTTSYAAGDDGATQMGAAAAPRFVDNANGTVTDKLTNLIWLKNANCFGTKTWALALTSASGLATATCGLTDGSTAGQWRLPNRRELLSLVDYGKATAPRLPTGHPFTSVQSNYYWSSSTYAPITTGAWYVYLSDGSTYIFNKTGSNYVWPVRAGQ